MVNKERDDMFYAHRRRIECEEKNLHYSVYGPSDKPDFLNGFPWHWHHEMELLRVISGNIIYRTKNAEYKLKAGDAAFVNLCVYHSINTLDYIKI